MNNVNKNMVMLTLFKVVKYIFPLFISFQSLRLSYNSQDYSKGFPTGGNFLHSISIWFSCLIDMFNPGGWKRGLVMSVLFGKMFWARSKHVPYWHTWTMVSGVFNMANTWLFGQLLLIMSIQPNSQLGNFQLFKNNPDL